MGTAYSTSINAQTWRCLPRGLGGARMQGRRASMEDYDAHVHRFVNPDWDLLLCLDGHGGDATAQLVSSIFADTLASHLKHDSTVAEVQAAMELTFEEVDAKVIEMQKSTSDGSGACCVCALITPTHFIVAFCGDCVAFVFRVNDDGTRVVRELTRDHEPHLPEEKARIEAAGNRVYMNEMGGSRIDGDLNVSRAFGDSIFKNSKPHRRMPRFDDEGLLVEPDPLLVLSHKTYAITAHPDIRVYERTEQDIMLLLGSDGLVDIRNGSVSDKRLVPDRLWEAVQLEGMNDPSRLGLLACDTSYTNGGADNMTALLWTALPPAWAKPQSEQDTEWETYMAGRRALLRKGERDLDEPDPFPKSHEELA